jgi:hypothetical protein
MMGGAELNVDGPNFCPVNELNQIVLNGNDDAYDIQ